MIDRNIVNELEPEIKEQSDKYIKEHILLKEDGDNPMFQMFNIFVNGELINPIILNTKLLDSILFGKDAIKQFEQVLFDRYFRIQCMKTNEKIFYYKIYYHPIGMILFTHNKILTFYEIIEKIKNNELDKNINGWLETDKELLGDYKIFNDIKDFLLSKYKL